MIGYVCVSHPETEHPFTCVCTPASKLKITLAWLLGQTGNRKESDRLPASCILLHNSRTIPMGVPWMWAEFSMFAVIHSCKTCRVELLIPGKYTERINDSIRLHCPWTRTQTHKLLREIACKHTTQTAHLRPSFRKRMRCAPENAAKVHTLIVKFSV